MTSTVNLLRIFLSSPGNLGEERNIVEEVARNVSKDIGTTENFFIETLRWESHAHSARGSSAQDIINNDIGDEYDIFIGIFGTRFGSATLNFGSGTEEEFQLALKRNEKTSSPEILFYFSVAPQPLSDIDAEQFLKISNFKKNLGPNGVLYFEFNSESSFRTRLYSDIIAAARKILKAGIIKNKVNGGYPSRMEFDPLAEWHSLLMEDSEINANHLIQCATERMSQVSADIHKMNKCTKNLMTALARESKYIGAPIQNLNVALLSSSMERAIRAMQIAFRQHHEIGPSISVNLQEALSFAQRSIVIFQNRNEFTDEISKPVLASLSQFKESFSSLADILDQTALTLEKSWSFGGPLDVEGRKMKAVIKDLSRILRNGILDASGLEAALSTAH